MHEAIARVLASTSVLLALTGVGGANVALAGTDEPTGSVQPDGVEEYFVVEAARGTLAGSGDDLELTLRGVDEDAHLFSSRPEEVTGTVPVKQLVNRWDEEGLAENPPSAAVAVLDGKGAGSASAVELTDPSYSDGTLSFDAEPLESLDEAPVAPEPRAVVAESTEEVPQEFGSASVLIDPENDVMQYCFARVINHSGTGIAGKGVQLIFPTSGGIKQLNHNEEKTVSSSGTFACNIDYVFRAGAGSGWGFAMAAATGKDNVSTCDRHCIRTVTHDTSTYRVTFELIK